MPVHTTCPVCGIAHLVLDSMRGKQIPCKNCKQRFVVSDGRGIKVAGPPPLPAEARMPAECAPPAAGLSSMAPPGVPSIPSGTAATAPRVPRDRARQRSDTGSNALLIAVIGAAAVLLLAAGGVGVWFFLKEAPQPAQQLVVQPAPAPPPVVEEKPKLPTKKPLVPRPVTPPGPAPGWTASPDPFPPGVKLTSVPRGKFPLPIGSQVLIPSTPSPYIAVGKNTSAKDVRQVVQLQTMQPAGFIPGKVPLTTLAVSPDGQYLAGTDRLQRTTIEVYSFKTGKSVRKLKAASKVDWVDFAASNRLVTVRNNPGSILEVWDLAAGNLLITRADPVPLKRAQLALSPGRRFVALFAQDKLAGPGKIILFDLVQLRQAGVLGVAPPEPAGAFQCFGLAFSPDGTELAGLFGNILKMRLRTWTMDQGSAKIDHPLPAGVQRAWTKTVAAGVRPIEWWPKRKGWLLFGTALIRYKTGTEVTHLPPPPGPQAPRCLLPGDLLASVSGLANPRFFEVTPLPGKK